MGFRFFDHSYCVWRGADTWQPFRKPGICHASTSSEVTHLLMHFLGPLCIADLATKQGFPEAKPATVFSTIVSPSKMRRKAMAEGESETIRMRTPMVTPGIDEVAEAIDADCGNRADVDEGHAPRRAG